MEQLTKQALQELVQQQILVNQLKECIELEKKQRIDSTCTEKRLLDAESDLTALKEKYVS